MRTGKGIAESQDSCKKIGYNKHLRNFVEQVKNFISGTMHMSTCSLTVIYASLKREWGSFRRLAVLRDGKFKYDAVVNFLDPSWMDIGIWKEICSCLFAKKLVSDLACCTDFQLEFLLFVFKILSSHQRLAWAHWRSASIKSINKLKKCKSFSWLLWAAWIFEILFWPVSGFSGNNKILAFHPLYIWLHARIVGKSIART